MTEFRSEDIEKFEQEDIDNNKTMAGLAYLIFFLPLIACPQSQYAKFHANQGLMLFILVAVGNIVLTLIPIIGWILLPLFGLITLALGILGLVNGFTGKAKRLPIIGNFDILK